MTIEYLLWLPTNVDPMVLIYWGATHNRSPLVLSMWCHPPRRSVTRPMWCRPHRRNVHWLDGASRPVNFINSAFTDNSFA